MNHCLTTDDKTPSERFEFWQEIVCKKYVSASAATDVRGDEFSGSLVSRELGPLVAAELEAPLHFWSRKPHHVRSDGQDVFIVSLIQRGDGELTQLGGSARLVAGDLAIYDCGAPFDYTLRAKTQLIKIPRQILESKLERPRDFLAVNIDRSNPLIPVLGELLTRALTIELSRRPRLAGRQETLERDRRDRRVDLRSAQGRFPGSTEPPGAREGQAVRSGQSG